MLRATLTPNPSILLSKPCWSQMSMGYIYQVYMYIYVCTPWHVLCPTYSTWLYMTLVSCLCIRWQIVTLSLSPQHCCPREAWALCQQICRALPWEMVCREGKAKDKSVRQGEMGIKWCIIGRVVRKGEDMPKTLHTTIIRWKASLLHESEEKRNSDQYLYCILFFFPVS